MLHKDDMTSASSHESSPSSSTKISVEEEDDPSVSESAVFEHNLGGDVIKATEGGQDRVEDPGQPTGTSVNVPTLQATSMYKIA